MYRYVNGLNVKYVNDLNVKCYLKILFLSAIVLAIYIVGKEKVEEGNNIFK